MGATFEGVIVTQTLYESGGRKAKFRPVVFREEDERFIPLELRRFNRYRVDTPEHYQNLLRWLYEAPSIVAPTIGQMPDLPPEAVPELFPGGINKDKKPTHNRPFPPNPAFTGREAELKNLGEQLQKGGGVEQRDRDEQQRLEVERRRRGEKEAYLPRAAGELPQERQTPKGRRILQLVLEWPSRQWRFSSC